jgi:hypothetical protein
MSFMLRAIPTKIAEHMYFWRFNVFFRRCHEWVLFIALKVLLLYSFQCTLQKMSQQSCA